MISEMKKCLECSLRTTTCEERAYHLLQEIVADAKSAWQSAYPTIEPTTDERVFVSRDAFERNKEHLAPFHSFRQLAAAAGDWKDELDRRDEEEALNMAEPPEFTDAEKEIMDRGMDLIMFAKAKWCEENPGKRLDEDDERAVRSYMEQPRIYAAALPQEFRDRFPAPLFMAETDRLLEKYGQPTVLAYQFPKLLDRLAHEFLAANSPVN